MSDLTKATDDVLEDSARAIAREQAKRAAAKQSPGHMTGQEFAQWSADMIRAGEAAKLKATEPQDE
jgi:hypothetical protein